MAPLEPDPPLSTKERALVVVLRLGGGVMLLAFFAVVLPGDWMAATHRWLGLGEWPASPVTDYLARSASALYGIHGGLLVLLSRDVRRYAPVVVYVSWAGILFGVAMIPVDLLAGMPLYWSLAEGPMVLALGTIMLWLARGIRSRDAASR